MVIEILRPNGDGSTPQLSKYPNTGTYYSKVNEATKDDDTTYLYTTSTSNQVCIFTLPNLVHAGKIIKITINAYCRSVYDGVAQFIYYTPSSVNPAVSKVYVVGSSYELMSWTLYTNNQTLLPWTRDEINNLEVGIGMRLIDDGDTRVTQLWVEVDIISSSDAPTFRGMFRGMR